MSAAGDTRRRRAWIVLPTLNEEDCIVTVMAGIGVALDGRPYVLCVVDDGSTDRTLERIQAYSDTHPRVEIQVIRRRKMHRGSQRGAAVREGLCRGLAREDVGVLIEMDSDGSHPPRELPEGMRLISEGGCDVAIASKYRPGSRIVDRPWSRRVLSYWANLWVRLLVDASVHDYSNGYRFYSRGAARLLCDRPMLFGSPIYLSEGLARILAAGLEAREFPSTYAGRREGLSKLRVVDLLKAGLAVLLISVRYHHERRRR